MGGNQPDDTGGRGPERGADPEFARPARHLQRQQTVEPDGGQHETENTEQGDESEREPFGYAGLRGKGPVGVVTDIGYLEPDESGELVLTALHPGKTAQEAIENTGWALRMAGNLRLTEPVNEKELRILREELDPSGIYVKGG